MSNSTDKSVILGILNVLKNYFIKYKWFFLVFIVLGIFFKFNSSVDPYISGLFYNSAEGFRFSHNIAVLAVYQGVHVIAVVLVVVFVVMLIYSFVKKSQKIGRFTRKSVIYLLFALLLSSGFVVNVLLKNNVGRPRPDSVTFFSGDKIFQPPFTVSNECTTNCSFVCGHASFGFYLMAFGFLFTGIRRKYIFSVTFIIGWIIGFVRIIQGRHFFTDVLFSFFFVFATVALLYEFMYNGKYSDKKSIEN